MLFVPHADQARGEWIYGGSLCTPTAGSKHPLVWSVDLPDAAKPGVPWRPSKLVRCQGPLVNFLGRLP
jgi:hypothetical protein